MSRFLEHAANLLEAANAAAQVDGGCSNMTVLLGRNRGVEIVMDSDWAADALRAERGADMAFQVCRKGSRITVEGRSCSGQSCRLEADLPQNVSRALLGRMAPVRPALPGWGQ